MDEDGLPIVGSGVDLTKLSSIPGLEDVTVEGACLGQGTADANGPVMMSNNQAEAPAETSPPKDVGEQQRTETTKENVLTVAKDPRYARYLKMVQVGVPVMAIKNKMTQEGLDPSLLDTPEAPVPDGGKTTEEADDDSSSSESSFSD
ncbi:hypothetical protein JZ751_022194 [Albula glossodonta]|uniref:WASH complex subunit 3 n=1 Tax=Albula glossodonta TaxID=121402 RepID=A0A8T2NLG9_9TELE|nr:hypothetical protein JZ751_022194 [Albula glossodonta]